MNLGSENFMTMIIREIDIQIVNLLTDRRKNLMTGIQMEMFV